MKKRNIFFVCLFFVGYSFSLLAFDESKLQEFEGKEIVYSSPYHNGAEALFFKAHDIRLSDNFSDDCCLLIDKNIYPLSELFIKNDKGIYENLRFALGYEGIGCDKGLRYYSHEWQGVRHEIQNFDKDIEKCVQPFYGAGIGLVVQESTDYEKCLDDVFSRVVRVFYTNHKNELISNYESLGKLLYKIYMTEPDVCDGRCGIFRDSVRVGAILRTKQRFIHDVLKDVENVWIEN